MFFSYFLLHGWKAALISITWCSGLYDAPDGAWRGALGTPLIICDISPLAHLVKHHSFVQELGNLHTRTYTWKSSWKFYHMMFQFGCIKEAYLLQILTIDFM